MTPSDENVARHSAEVAKLLSSLGDRNDAVPQIKEYCLALQAKLANEDPSHSIANHLAEIVWPAMRNIGDAPAKPECLARAAGNEGFIANVRETDEWVEQCIDKAIRIALDWCTERVGDPPTNRFADDTSNLGVVGLIIQRAIERARANWNEGYSIIAQTMNSFLSEKCNVRAIQAERLEVCGTLRPCRVELANALRDIPVEISQVPDAQDDHWQPWVVGLVNGPNGQLSRVGCNYAPLSGDELEAIKQFLSERPSDWPWETCIVRPIESDAFEWQKRFDGMIDRLFELSRELQQQHLLVDRDADYGNSRIAEKCVPAPTELTENPSSEFTGGLLEIFEDRIELCKVDICSGNRSHTKRRILLALANRVEGGRFIAISAEDLARDIGIPDRTGTISGAIRNLRTDIGKALASAEIDCKRMDVIQRSNTGYHLASCVTLQGDASAGLEAIVEDPSVPHTVEDEGDVHGVHRVHDVHGVHDDRDGRDNEEVITSEYRQSWILEQLRAGRKLQSSAVAAQFRCSRKTAHRDFEHLRRIGSVRFIGPAKTGHYRLTNNPDT